MPDIENLRTARLTCHRSRIEDLDDFIRLHGDPAVTATLGGPRTAEQTRDFLERTISHWEVHGFGWWTLRDPKSGRFVGRGGLRYNTFDRGEILELGYAFVPDCWGRGLGTELALESLRVGFEELDLPEVVAITLPDNLASRRVMEKAGMRHERDMTWVGLAHVLYRIRREEWGGEVG
jgi:ribosomal-protein-alanine N-acetyltransferase